MADVLLITKVSNRPI